MLTIWEVVESPSPAERLYHQYLRHQGDVFLLLLVVLASTSSYHHKIVRLRQSVLGTQGMSLSPYSEDICFRTRHMKFLSGKATCRLTEHRWPSLRAI